jgi:hypothetical protein
MTVFNFRNESLQAINLVFWTLDRTLLEERTVDFEHKFKFPVSSLLVEVNSNYKTLIVSLNKKISEYTWNGKELTFQGSNKLPSFFLSCSSGLSSKDKKLFWFIFILLILFIILILLVLFFDS